MKWRRLVLQRVGLASTDVPTDHIVFLSWRKVDTAVSSGNIAFKWDVVDRHDGSIWLDEDCPSSRARGSTLGPDQFEIFFACPPMRGTHVLSLSRMSTWIGFLPLANRGTGSTGVSPTPTVTPSPPPSLIRNDSPVDFHCHVILLTRTGTRPRGGNRSCWGRLLQRITAFFSDDARKKRPDPLR